MLVIQLAELEMYLTDFFSLALFVLPPSSLSPLPSRGARAGTPSHCHTLAMVRRSCLLGDMTPLNSFFLSHSVPSYCQQSIL